MNRLSLRYNRLKLKTAGKLRIILEEFIEYTLIHEGKTGGCQHVTVELANTRISTGNVQKSPRSQCVCVCGRVHARAQRDCFDKVNITV
jgi:hypothetical protein